MCLIARQSPCLELSTVIGMPSLGHLKSYCLMVKLAWMMRNPLPTTYFQLRGIIKRTSAPQQHTRIVDRKIAVLRDSLHKLCTQLDEEGLEVPFPRILSDAVLALNSLTSINGCTPYTAVLGRMPTLLPADDCMMSDGIPDVCSRHSYRLREIAVQSIAEGTAQERVKRAMNSQTRPSGEELEYKVGQQVDWCRAPVSRDVSGWRGPGTVVDLSRIEHGRIGVRTSTDQVITCRLQDLRHSLTFLSDDLAVFFGVDDPVATQGSQAHHAQQFVQEHVDDLKPGTVLTLGHVQASSGEWVVTPQTPQSDIHRHLLQACGFLAEAAFHVTTVAAVRLARAVRTLTARPGYSAPLCLYWSASGSRQISFLHSADTKLSLPSLVGQAWPDVRLIQFLLVPDELEWLSSQKWSLPLGEASPSSPAASTTAAENTQQQDRLSTIPED